MKNYKKIVRRNYFKLKANPPDSSKWKTLPGVTQLPSVCNDFLYKKNKDSYLDKGPRLWLYLLFLRNGPMSSKDVWDRYLSDEEAKSQEFFKSKTDLTRRHIYFYLMEEDLVKVPSDNKESDVSAFDLNKEKALLKINPFVLAMVKPLHFYGLIKKYRKDFEELENQIKKP